MLPGSQLSQASARGAARRGRRTPPPRQPAGAPRMLENPESAYRVPSGGRALRASGGPTGDSAREHPSGPSGGSPWAAGAGLDRRSPRREMEPARYALPGKTSPFGTRGFSARYSAPFSAPPKSKAVSQACYNLGTKGWFPSSVRSWWGPCVALATHRR
jgi:hypothetical protein